MRFAAFAGRHPAGGGQEIVGAFPGGLLIPPLFGTGTINQGYFSVGSLIVSLLGAVVLLALVGLFRRPRPT